MAMGRAKTALLAGQDDAGIVVACPALNLSGHTRLQLPATEVSSGPEIGIPRRKMLLALGAHGMQLWKTNGKYKPVFHAGSIPTTFITNATVVRDDRPLFGRHELVFTLADDTRLRVGIPRNHLDDAIELAMRVTD